MIEEFEIEIERQVYSYVFLYEKREEKDVLLRVFGNAPVVHVPNHFSGIGAYCFAAGERLSEEMRKQAEEILANHNSQYTVLCGEYVTSIVLPDSVEQLGRCAFYNCKGLEEIQIGKYLNLLDSDVFMNCHKLHRILLRADVVERTGLKSILGQLNQGIEVQFQDGASIFYPEYMESYDEISPAHIFAINIAGEGYRARQQFKDGVLDIAGYDRVFDKANALEDVQTLFQMAIGRLRNPIQLSEEARRGYEDFVHKNIDEVMKIVVEKKNLELLKWIAEAKVLSREDKVRAMQLCIATGWTAGSTWLIMAR